MIFGSPNPRPRGVPLDTLQDQLKPATFKTSRDGDALIVPANAALLESLRVGLGDDIQ